MDADPVRGLELHDFEVEDDVLSKPGSVLDQARAGTDALGRLRLDQGRLPGCVGRPIGDFREGALDRSVDLHLTFDTHL